MTKFITPVSMQVTQEQFEKDLKRPLIDLGYDDTSITNDWSVDNILVTNYMNGNGRLTNMNTNRETHNRYFIEQYNPQLFLALAAQTEGEDWIIGEWLMHGNRIFKVKRLDGHNYSLGYAQNDAKDLYRKATKQELINHLTQNKMEKKIIGYKLIKPEYKAAVGKITGYTSLDYTKYPEEAAPNTRSYDALKNAGVLDIWFTPTYQRETKTFKVGSFEVVVKDGKVFHGNDDITNFVKSLVATFTFPEGTYGGYTAIMEDVTFSKTGCQNTPSKLSEWKEIYNFINK